MRALLKVTQLTRTITVQTFSRSASEISCILPITKLQQQILAKCNRETQKFVDATFQQSDTQRMAFTNCSKLHEKEQNRANREPQRRTLFSFLAKKCGKRPVFIVYVYFRSSFRQLCLHINGKSKSLGNKEVGPQFLPPVSAKKKVNDAQVYTFPLLHFAKHHKTAVAVRHQGYIEMGRRIEPTP